MLIEIRRYEIVPGRRDEFVEWFERDVRPVMESAGMRIIGHFVDVEDPDAFFYLRSFADEQERDAQYAAVYETDRWREELAPYALALETSSRVETVTPAGSTVI
jgi:quinol monooxygenase YgiN